VALIGRREEETLEGGFGHSLGLILRNLRRGVDSMRVRVNPNRFNFGSPPPANLQGSSINAFHLTSFHLS
jgi:hypothetical protein